MMALVVLSIFAPVTLAAESPRLLVMPVHATDDGLAQAAHDEVVKAVQGALRFRLPSIRERDLVLARAAQSGLTCDARTADCATRIGVFSGFDFVLVTTIADGAPPIAKMALHDCTDGRLVRVAEAPLSENAASRVTGLHKLTAHALGESVPLVGTLQIRGPSLAAVDVDGTPRGTAPLTLVVSAGVHDVVMRSTTGTELRVRVTVPLDEVVPVDDTVTTGAARAATAEGSPERTSGLTFGSIGGAGLATVGLVAAATAAALAVVVAPDGSDRASMTAREYNDAVLFGRVLLGASALGLVVAAAGAGVIAVSALGFE
jgi:hypothetical protein